MRSKDQNAIYLREWRRKNPEYSKDYREQHKEEARLRRHEPRTKLIDKLGNKCIRCGFLDIRALQLDHINGGGTQEIKAVKYNTVMLYRFYLTNLELARKRLQVLCANCNWIKRSENKEYG